MCRLRKSGGASCRRLAFPVSNSKQFWHSGELTVSLSRLEESAVTQKVGVGMRRLSLGSLSCVETLGVQVLGWVLGRWERE